MIQIQKSEVEHEIKFYLRVLYSTYALVAEWYKHLKSNPLIVAVVSSVVNGGGNFFLPKLFEILDLNLYRKVRNYRFVLKWKMKPYIVLQNILVTTIFPCIAKLE